MGQLYCLAQSLRDISWSVVVSYPDKVYFYGVHHCLVSDLEQAEQDSDVPEPMKPAPAADTKKREKHPGQSDEQTDTITSLERRVWKEMKTYYAIILVGP